MKCAACKECRFLQNPIYGSIHVALKSLLIGSINNALHLKFFQSFIAILQRIESSMIQIMTYFFKNL